MLILNVKDVKFCLVTYNYNLIQPKRILILLDNRQNVYDNSKKYKCEK